MPKFFACCAVLVMVALAPVAFAAPVSCTGLGTIDSPGACTLFHSDTAYPFTLPWFSNPGIVVILDTIDAAGVGLNGEAPDFSNVFQTNRSNWSDVLSFTYSGGISTVTLLSDTAPLPNWGDVAWFIGETGSVTIWSPDYPDDNYKLYYVDETPAGQVPEPSTMALMFAGLGSFGLFLRKRRSSRG
jgi:hypothetical protein